MRKNNSLILVIFFTLILLMLSGTLFHWKYRNIHKKITEKRKKITGQLTKEITNTKRAGDARNQHLVILKQSFKKIDDMMFIGVLNSKNIPIFIRTRLNSKQTESSLNLLTHLTQSVKNHQYFKTEKNNDSFYFSTQITGEERARILFVYDNNVYNTTKISILKQYATTAFIIILTGILIPLIISRISVKNKNTDIEVLNKDKNESDSNIEYPHQKNVVLEKEVEIPSELSDFMISSSIKKNCEELLEYIIETIKNHVESTEIVIMLDKKHSIRAFKNFPDNIKIISDQDIQKAIVKLRNRSFIGSDKIMLPISANGVPYGLIKIKDINKKYSDNEIKIISGIFKLIGLQLYNFILYEIAVIDNLTGLYTRRHFNKSLSDEIEISIRHRREFSFIMIDIDDLKNINNKFGHIEGDFVLREISGLISSSVRKVDSVFRFGGEEIAVILPECGINNAFQVSEKIRTGIETHEFTSKENNEINVTASFGIKSFNPETPESPETIIIDAESALYKAKKSGKNQSVVFNNSKAGQIEYTILSNNNFTGKNETMLLLEAQEIDK